MPVAAVAKKPRATAVYQGKAFMHTRVHYDTLQVPVPTAATWRYAGLIEFRNTEVIPSADGCRTKNIYNSSSAMQQAIRINSSQSVSQSVDQGAEKTARLTSPHLHPGCPAVCCKFPPGTTQKYVLNMPGITLVQVRYCRG